MFKKTRINKIMNEFETKMTPKSYQEILKEKKDYCGNDEYIGTISPCEIKISDIFPELLVLPNSFRRLKTEQPHIYYKKYSMLNGVDVSKANYYCNGIRISD